MPTQLMKYDVARQALAEAKTLKEVHAIRNISVAIEEAARRMSDKETEINFHEMRVRSERLFGELSAKLEKKQGARTDRTSGNVAQSSIEEKKAKTQVLAELGAR